MDIKKIVGKRIQNYRKALGITQEQLAEKIGIDTISLSKIETGRNYPTAENITKLANILGIDIYELFVNNNIMTNEELLGEISKGISSISQDNKKLHVINATIKSLL